MSQLVVDLAFEAGEGEGEGVEGQGEVVGFVGEGASEGVFDAVRGKKDLGTGLRAGIEEGWTIRTLG